MKAFRIEEIGYLLAICYYEEIYRVQQFLCLSDPNLKALSVVGYIGTITNVWSLM